MKKHPPDFKVGRCINIELHLIKKARSQRALLI